MTVEGAAMAVATCSTAALSVRPAETGGMIWVFSGLATENGENLSVPLLVDPVTNQVPCIRP